MKESTPKSDHSAAKTETRNSFRWFSVNDLKWQEIIHTNEKPLSCSMCEKKFTQSGHSKKHERIHTSIGPFCCPLCDYESTTAAILRIHERIHTGDNPFSCSKCDKTCTQARINESIRVIPVILTLSTAYVALTLRDWVYYQKSYFLPKSRIGYHSQY